MPDVVIVGGGHNGLVCACYLARAGLAVQVLEQATALGGGSRTEELVAGYRFDTHSVAHNIINMTDIPAELRLAEAGLDYIEMDPFAVAVSADQPLVRFFRSVEQTVAELGDTDPAEAARYAAFMRDALPVVRSAVAGLDAGAGRGRALRAMPGRALDALRVLRRYGGNALIAELTAPYARVLAERLGTERVRAPLAAFAAHASASPEAPGSAFFVLWQAAYHAFGQWHARGGAQGLTDALAHRLSTYGGTWRTGADVVRIRRDGDRVRGVELADGERIDAPYVVTAIDPKAALLELLDPPLDGPAGAELAATARGNAVQMLVHLAVDRLPAYPGGRPGDWNGLQSYVDSVACLAAGFAAAGDRRLPADPVPTYAFTPSALDDSLAPAGRHTVYLACPCAPYDVRGGWDAAAEGFANRMIATVEARAPGFRASILDARIRTPETMARELAWPGAHPMHLDLSLDQLAWMRPTRRLAGHATPVRGLFVSGAGSSPVGGIAGTPGRAAARAVLASRPKR